MTSKRSLSQKKVNPWKAVWNIPTEIQLLILLFIIFVIVFGVGIYCQAPISHGHTTGMI
jgi:hypothetical protein